MLITTFKGMEGKTIERALLSSADDTLSLLFTDGSYAFAKSRQAYDMTEIYLAGNAADYELYQLGAITSGEYSRRQEAVRQAREHEHVRREQLSREQELAQLARLKAKYEI